LRGVLYISFPYDPLFVTTRLILVLYLMCCFLLLCGKAEAQRDSVPYKDALCQGEKNTFPETFPSREQSRKEAQAYAEALARQQYFTLLAVVITIVMAGLAGVYYRSFKREQKLNLDIAERNEEIRMQAEKLSVTNAVLTQLNDEIAEQKEEIQAQATRLEQSNQTVIRINQQQEEVLRVRTDELTHAYKELDTFFYKASHDFRRPVTTFLGLVQLARITVKDSTVLELFDKVQQTANHLDKMLIKLQSISDVGLQRLQFTEIVVNDILHSVFRTFKDELAVAQVDFHVTAGVSCFHSYPSLVTVILGNLIENSINFRCTKGAYIHVQIYRQDDEVVLRVQDNGQGIQPNYHDGIFDMYFRSNENSKGNGLGLYIVKKAVQKLHGRISFESIPYEGSTFYVYLPYQSRMPEDGTAAGAS
jgi:signal transduction histidine kinase